MKKTSKYYNNPAETYSAAPKVGCDPSEIIKVVREMVEGWTAGDEEVTQISGGITNTLHKVKSSVGDEILVRLYGENTDKLIDRDVENRILAELSTAGFAPGFFGKFATGRLEEFLPARPLKPEEMAHPDFIPAIASELHKLHKIVIPPVNGPSTIKTIKKFLEVARGCEFEGEKKKQLDALRLDTLEEEIALLEVELEGVSEFMKEVVFCHKDLLAGNVLVPVTYEGGKVEKVQIIDFEYSEWDYRGFDFGNHFAEHAGYDCDYEKNYPSTFIKQSFIEGYLGGVAPPVPVEKLVADADLFAVASHMYWAVWSIVQSRYSPIDFDFMDYARQRFAGYYYHKQFYFSKKAAEPRSLQQTLDSLLPQ